MAIRMGPLSRSFRIIHTPPITSEMFRQLMALRIEGRHLGLKSHYAAPLGTHFRGLAWNAGSDKQTDADGTCELIIYYFGGDFKQVLSNYLVIVGKSRTR
jgi:hypothetical protein